MDLHRVAFAIPVLNAGSRLPACLERIVKQDYPKHSMEIIVADGGSTDRTVAVAQAYNATVVHNARRLAEPGKEACVDCATGDLIAFVDDDNYIEDPDWLLRMTKPFAENDAVFGAEPL